MGVSAGLIAKLAGLFRFAGVFGISVPDNRRELLILNCYMGTRFGENNPEDHVRYARIDLMGMVREDLLKSQPHFGTGCRK